MFLDAYIIGGLAILGMMTILWIASLLLKDSSIVDIFWGAGFVLSNWVYFFLTPQGFPGRKWLINTLVTIWGLRLSIYILWRNWGKGEDYRYQKMREQAGGRWWWQSFFQVFLLQGLLMWIISIPLLAAQISDTPARLTAIDFIAIAVWTIGFFFEAVGDLQMARFKADPANKGKVLDSGVWRYTRHPNYFGDATQWWAYYLVAVAAGGFWTIFSPIIMTFFLLRVSGVTLLEKNLKETKPKYKDYIERTSAFIPWFPKEKKEKENSEGE
jgi:steroid 5-alpha reductase family enzyme